MSESRNETTVGEQDSAAIKELKDFVDSEIKGLRADFFRRLQSSGTESVLYSLILINLQKIVEKYLDKDTKLIEVIWPNEKGIILDYLDNNLDENFRKNIAENKANLKDNKELATLIIKIMDKEKSMKPTFEPLFEKLMIITETMQKMGKYFEDMEFVLKILVSELKQFHSIGMFSRTVINIPSEQLSKPIISRGNLKIQIDIGKPILVAGEEFSIFVKITNPYEVPLVLFSVDTQIPVDLRDVLGELREKPTGNKSTQEIASIFDYFRVPSLNWRKNPEEDRIARGIATTDLDYLKRTSQLNPSPILLQPDDSIVKQFILETKNKWLFTPIALTLEIQVRYGVDHREHLDTEKIDLTIQSALSSIAVGAIIGGILGSVVGILFRPNRSNYMGIIESSSLNMPELPLPFNNSGNTDYFHLFVNFIPWFINFFGISSINFVLHHASYLLLSMILSSMVVVAFARKSGVQKIISIEDFYGGLFLGFLIGFSGPEYAINLITGQGGHLAPNMSENVTNLTTHMNLSTQSLTEHLLH